MALKRAHVEKWVYPDVSRDLDKIRDEVLELMEGSQPEVKALTAERDSLLKAIKDKDAELSEAKNDRDVAQKAAAEVEPLRQQLADVEVERDALAAQVLELEKAADEAKPAEPVTEPVPS